MKQGWLIGAGLLLFLLNLFDALATLHWQRNLDFYDANPLMAYALRAGVFEFLLLKNSIVLISICILAWAQNHVYSFIRFAIFCLLFLYTMLALYHLSIFLR